MRLRGRRAPIPVGYRRAGFYRAHHPVFGHAQVEPFEEGREVIPSLRILPFEIYINAVEALLLDECRNAVFERDAPLSIAQKRMQKFRIARHDGRNKADVIFLRLCTEREPRLAVERAVVEKRPVGLERIDERVHLGERCHMGKHRRSPSPLSSTGSTPTPRRASASARRRPSEHNRQDEPRQRRGKKSTATKTQRADASYV